MERKCIAIDLKSFYASVECMARGLDPLTTKLVVADPSRTEKTICLAVSPALKAYGIPGRARLFEVFQKLREVEKRTGKAVEFIIAPPQMSKYISVSAQIYETYLKFVSAEDIHVYSIDECFIDVTDYIKLYQTDAKKLATQMIKEVLKQTGITATAGIGTNLYLAKIAMDIVAKHAQSDEDGVRIGELDEMSYRRLLWSHRPLTDFWRIGNGIAKRLGERGLFTMGDIARASLENIDSLYHAFGIDAELLIDHAWGYEPCTMKEIKEYKPQSNSLSSGQVLHEPYPYEKAKIIVREMTEQMVLEMVEKGLVTDNLTLTLVYDRCSVDQGDYKGEVIYDFFGRALPKAAHGTANLGKQSNSTKQVTEAVMQLFERIVDPKLYVRRVGLSANNLEKDAYEQLDLFTNPEDREKERRLQEAMLTIKKRFGNNSILKGTNLEEGATTMERNSQIGGHRV